MSKEPRAIKLPRPATYAEIKDALEAAAKEWDESVSIRVIGEYKIDGGISPVTGKEGGRIARFNSGFDIVYCGEPTDTLFVLPGWFFDEEDMNSYFKDVGKYFKDKPAGQPKS